jgi:aminocarboxymuconate-semialdehyde decarboxylase
MPGIEVRSNTNGTYLGDKSLWPFWEAAEALDALVFVHLDHPIIGGDKLSEYYLGNLVGNPIETTRSIAPRLSCSLNGRETSSIPCTGRARAVPV